MEIITGYKGAAHVTAAQDGATNAAIFGAGQYILNVSNKMAATKTDNNTVAIADGFGINQGRYFATAGENVTIETGTANAKREDLIVARYEKAASGVETIAIKVIKGTAGESYTTPSHTTGDIIAGASVDEMVLYKVHLNGATLEEIVKVAEVKESFGGGINLITSAAYNALSTEEKNKRDYLITDLDATPLDASVINYTDSTSVKTALDSLNNSLAKLKPTLLWSNPSSSTSFAEQTISIDLSDYDYVEIETCYHTSTTQQRNIFKSYVGNNSECLFVMSGMIYGRNFSITNSGIVAKGGFKLTAYNNVTVDNSYGIPTRIWGYK